MTVGKYQEKKDAKTSPGNVVEYSSFYLETIWKNSSSTEKYQKKPSSLSSKPNIKDSHFPRIFCFLKPNVFQLSYTSLTYPSAMLFKSIVSLALVAAAAAQATKGKAFDHIFIIFLENTVRLQHELALWILGHFSQV